MPSLNLPEPFYPPPLLLLLLVVVVVVVVAQPQDFPPCTMMVVGIVSQCTWTLGQPAQL